MLIASLNGSTSSLANKEIETGVQRFAFKVYGQVATLATEEATPDAEALLTSLLGDCTISLQKQDGVSNVTLMQSLNLRQIAEASTHNEGLIRITRVYHATAANNIATAYFTVEVGTDSAYAANDGAKLILTIEGKPANMSMDIWAIDHPVKSSSFIKYDNKYVNAAVAKEFDTRGYHAMSLPVSLITSLELHYSNGSVLKLTKEEYQQILQDSNDPVAMVNNKIYLGHLPAGQGVISIESVWKAVVTLSSSTNFYLVKLAS